MCDEYTKEADILKEKYRQYEKEKVNFCFNIAGINNKEKIIELLNNVNGLVTLKEIQCVKQLIKIKGIEKIKYIGFEYLKKIYENKLSFDSLNFELAEKDFGNLSEKENIETYLVIRKLAKYNILIDKNEVRKQVKTGLRFEQLNKDAINALKESNNKTRTLFKIKHQALLSETEKKVKNIFKDDQVKIEQNISFLRKIVEDPERMKYLDECSVNIGSQFYDMLLLKIIEINKGEYPFGNFTEKDSEDIESVITILLSEMTEDEPK